MHLVLFITVIPLYPSYIYPYCFGSS
jgi:hypothetical protein